MNDDPGDGVDSGGKNASSPPYYNNNDNNNKKYSPTSSEKRLGLAYMDAQNGDDDEDVDNNDTLTSTANTNELLTQCPSPSTSPSVYESPLSTLNQSDHQQQTEHHYQQEVDNNYNQNEKIHEQTGSSTTIINEETEIVYDDEDDENNNHNSNPKSINPLSTSSTISVGSPLSYMSRVEQNKKRNRQKLRELGFGGQNQTPLKTNNNGRLHIAAHELNPISVLDDDEDDDFDDDDDDDENLLLSELVPSQFHHQQQSNQKQKPKPKGMIFRTKYNQKNPIDHHHQSSTKNLSRSPPFTSNNAATTFSMTRLHQIYPHRKSQIRLLHSCFHTTLRQTSSSSLSSSSCFSGTSTNNTEHMIYIPTPIFITGESGTGKTSIVKDVLYNLQRKARNRSKQQDKQLHQQQQQQPITKHKQQRRGGENNVGIAYINCKTIGMTSKNIVHALLQSAHEQLVNEFEDHEQREQQKRKRKVKRNIGVGIDVIGQKKHMIMNSENNNDDSTTNRTGNNSSSSSNATKRQKVVEDPRTRSIMQQINEESTFQSIAEIIQSTTGSQDPNFSIHDDDGSDDVDDDENNDLDDFDRDDTTLHHEQKEEDDEIQVEEDEIHDEEDWIETKKQMYMKKKISRQHGKGYKKVTNVTAATNSDNDRRRTRSRRNKDSATINTSSSSAAAAVLSTRHNQTATTSTLRNHSSTSSPKVKTKQSSTKIQTPMAFGRAMNKYCGTTKYGSLHKYCAFLILDHAERLLDPLSSGCGASSSSSMSTEQRSQRMNLLSQLLLLPKVMNLNLTIVVITDTMLLENTRINNIMSNSKMFGCICDAINPIRCHFDSYKGKAVFKEILMTPRLRKSITGETTGLVVNHENDDVYQPLLIKLYESLVEVIIQSVESTTRDIREMLRLLRLIWPLYLRPILNGDNDNSSNNDASLVSLLLKKSCTRTSGNEKQEVHLNGRVSEKLGQKVRPYVRQMLNDCLLQPGNIMHQKKDKCDNNVEVELPYYSVYLLLAAYLCQANKAENDLKLYTNRASGQRRRGRRSNQSNDTQMENVTHASSNKAQQNLKNEKMPSFPLERLLSIFSSITGKYAIVKGKSKELGTTTTFAKISELEELGYISCIDHSTNARKSNIMSTSSLKYCCKITKKQAEQFASQVKFPLSNYLTENF